MLPAQWTAGRWWLAKDSRFQVLPPASGGIKAHLPPASPTILSTPHAMAAPASTPEVGDASTFIWCGPWHMNIRPFFVTDGRGSTPQITLLHHNYSAKRAKSSDRACGGSWRGPFGLGIGQPARHTKYRKGPPRLLAALQGTSVCRKKHSAGAARGKGSQGFFSQEIAVLKAFKIV